MRGAQLAEDGGGHDHDRNEATRSITKRHGLIVIVRPSTSKQLMIQEIKRSVSTMPCLCPTQPQNLCSNLTNLTLLGSDLICGRVFAYMRRLTPDSNLSQLPTLRIKAIPQAWKIAKLSSFPTLFFELPSTLLSSPSSLPPQLLHFGFCPIFLLSYLIIVPVGSALCFFIHALLLFMLQKSITACY